MPRAFSYLIVFFILCAVGFAALKYSYQLEFGFPDIANGKALYDKYCDQCHGASGTGNGELSASLDVKPDNIYKELTNPFGLKQELLNSVLEGDNGENGKMPAFRNSLSKADIADIFGYIEHINDNP